MISKRTKYGLKALIYLGRAKSKELVGVTEIAEKESIPKKFLEAILLDLKNHGVLQSKKGKGGGYSLGREPELISFGEVIRILEGPLSPLPCTSQTAYRSCEECKDERTCGVRIAIKEVRDLTAKILDGTSLAGVIDKIEQAESETSNVFMYTI